jgi:hypothetical protein
VVTGVARFNIPVQNGLHFLGISAEIKKSNNEILTLHRQFSVVILGKTKQNKNGALLVYFIMLAQDFFSLEGVAHSKEKFYFLIFFN